MQNKKKNSKKPNWKLKKGIGQLFFSGDWYGPKLGTGIYKNQSLKLLRNGKNNIAIFS